MKMQIENHGQIINIDPENPMVKITFCDNEGKEATMHISAWVVWQEIWQNAMTAPVIKDSPIS